MTNTSVSPIVNLLSKAQNFVFLDFAGPRVLPLRYCINLFKGTTFLWVIFLMIHFQNYSSGMWLYLFLHGTYGMAWLAKDLSFPDGRFMEKAALGSNILCFVFLCGYWLIPLPLAAGYGINQPSIYRIISLIGIYLLGLALMMGADYQKTTTLKRRPGLISDGLFSRSREILIYSSFALCSGHLLGFIMVHAIACLVFALNIYLKDKLSYERKKGWNEYKQQSYILLPKILPTLPLNFALYSIIGMTLWSFFAKESPTSFANFGFFSSSIPTQ